MTRVAYFECFSGASGDMILGALVDAGWPVGALRAALKSMQLGGWSLDVQETKKGALRATQIKIGVTEPQPERDVRDIRPMIEASGLPDEVKRRAIALFDELAAVEGLEHDQPPETVHFHEVGALDSILDIVGACAGLHALGIARIYVSPINVGGGIVSTRDGILPVPGPAALELLRRKGAPIYSSEYGPEFLTPTGALVLATLADGFGAFPPMRVEQIGYGAGQKDFQIPNVLRVSIGPLRDGWRGLPLAATASPRWRQPTSAADGEHGHDRGAEGHDRGAEGHDRGADSRGTVGHGDDQGHTHGSGEDHHHGQAQVGGQDYVVQLDTNIDNMNPEFYGYLSERLFALGALDVTLAPVFMKKGRPGTVLSVLVPHDLAERALEAVFLETTTLGIRVREVARRTLERVTDAVETPFGPIRVKVALIRGQTRSAAPEYEDCQAAAQREGVPLRAVYDAAAFAARELAPKM